MDVERTIARRWLKPAVCAVGLELPGVGGVSPIGGDDLVPDFRGPTSIFNREDHLDSSVEIPFHQISATEIYHHRLYVPRVEVSETADAQWTRTQEARWGLTFAALSPASGTTLAVWLTDDPAVLLATPGGGSLAAPGKSD